MADFQHRELSGTVFPNKYKKEDKHPDYKGNALIEGKLWDVAMWKKSGKNGEFWSLSLSVPRQQGQQPAPQAQTTQRPQSRPQTNAEAILGAEPYQGERPAPATLDESIPF